jgi:hypothetical protein
MNNYDQLFSDIAPILDRIAERRNLVIEKYHHDQPLWELCFSHPQKGQAKIEVHRNEPSKLRVVGVWWLDDYATAVRRIRWGEPLGISLPSSFLYEKIEHLLEHMLSWKAGKWTQEVAGFEKIWHRHSKTEFEAMMPKWPIPR